MAAAISYFWSRCVTVTHPLMISLIPLYLNSIYVYIWIKIEIVIIPLLNIMFNVPDGF